MAWWKLFWNPVGVVAETPEEKFETSAFENVISEPVRSIVKAMISDRKRFIVQVEHGFSASNTIKYAVMDIDTEEEFHAKSCFYHGYDSYERQYFGPAWAKTYEVKWAVETVSNHYRALRDRASRIQTARERNRLIEIYA